MCQTHLQQAFGVSGEEGEREGGEGGRKKGREGGREGGMVRCVKHTFNKHLVFQVRRKVGREGGREGGGDGEVCETLSTSIWCFR